MKDDADPLAGWSLPEVLKQRVGHTSNDIYGKLYCHIHDQLSSFRRNLRSGICCDLKLYNMDAAVLARHLGQDISFDRIEVLCIHGLGYLPIERQDHRTNLTHRLPTSPMAHTWGLDRPLPAWAQG